MYSKHLNSWYTEQFAWFFKYSFAERLAALQFGSYSDKCTTLNQVSCVSPWQVIHTVAEWFCFEYHEIILISFALTWLRSWLDAQTWLLTTRFSNPSRCFVFQFKLWELCFQFTPLLQLRRDSLCCYSAEGPGLCELVLQCSSLGLSRRLVLVVARRFISSHCLGPVELQLVGLPIS
jgi:hypothetical protein